MSAKLRELFILIGIGAALAIIMIVLLTLPGRQTTHDNDNIIQFGSHKWRVLDIQGNYALIISENIISHRMYHNTNQAVTWETSDIREYLNSTFLNTFNETDRARIRETIIINNDNPWLGTNGGENTKDKIFLLSIEEVVRYFGDSGQLENSPDGVSWIWDEYSETRIAQDITGSASWWWLRSPGFSPFGAASVSGNGILSVHGSDVFWSGGAGGGVRPALWLILYD